MTDERPEALSAEAHAKIENFTAACYEMITLLGDVPSANVEGMDLTLEKSQAMTGVTVARNNIQKLQKLCS